MFCHLLTPFAVDRNAFSALLLGLFACRKSLSDLHPQHLLLGHRPQPRALGKDEYTSDLPLHKQQSKVTSGLLPHARYKSLLLLNLKPLLKMHGTEISAAEVICTLLLGVVMLPQSASHPLSNLSCLALLPWLAAASFEGCTRQAPAQ